MSTETKLVPSRLHNARSKGARGVEGRFRPTHHTSCSRPAHVMKTTEDESVIKQLEYLSSFSMSKQSNRLRLAEYLLL